MSFAIIVDGAAVEIFPGIPFEDAAGIQRPANWLDLASSDNRAEAGVLDIVEPPVAPPGQYNAITGLTVQDGKPVRTFTVEAVPTPADPVPNEVADWQFAGQAAVEGIITQAEALAWAGSGTVPQVLWNAVDKLVTDPAQHFQVSMLLVGAKSFQRDNPLVPMLGAVLNKDTAGLDQFWRDASKRGV